MVRENKARKADKVKATNEGSSKEKEVRQKQERPVSKFLTYPGEQESPGQQAKKSKSGSKPSDKGKKSNKRTQKDVTTFSVKRKIVFKDMESSKGAESPHKVASANANQNAMGLLNPDPDRNWVEGVKRSLLNKNLPVCQEKSQEGSPGHVPVDHDFDDHDNDGINIEVDAEDLDYVDDIPNPQEPENERMMEPILLDGCLDDSDGLEQGATTSILAEQPEPVINIVHDKIQSLQQLSKEQRDEILRKDPVLKSMLNQLLDERLNELIPGGIINKTVNTGKNVKPDRLNKPTNSTKGMKQQSNSKAKCAKDMVVNQVIKSPSDTTIYAPALVHRNQMLNSRRIFVMW